MKVPTIGYKQIQTNYNKSNVENTLNFNKPSFGYMPNEFQSKLIIRASQAFPNLADYYLESIVKNTQHTLDASDLRDFCLDRLIALGKLVTSPKETNPTRIFDLVA